jgi:serine/threonine-protein kinase RsbW
MQAEMGDRVAESDKPGSDRSSDPASPAASRDHAVFSQTYPAVVESVAEIRSTVVQFATRAGVAPAGVEAVKLALSEAATNVVLHAYADLDRPGLIEVEATHEAGELCVSVADTGAGLQPGRGRPGLGLGLAIIEQLADRVELLQGDGHGLRVVMRFAVPAHMRDSGRD